MKSALKVFVASLAFAAASAQAVVGPTAYYDFTTFSNATLGGLGGDGFVFDSLAPGGGTTESFFGNPVTVAGSGVSFTANESIIADAGALGNPSVIYTAKTNTFPNTITATLTGATAIGFYYGSYNVTNSVLNATVTAGGSDYTFGSLIAPSTLTLGPVANTYNFVGFTSLATATITKVVFTQAGTDNALDIQRFHVGTIAAIPEPSAALMFGVGLALLGAIGRRRRV